MHKLALWLLLAFVALTPPILATAGDARLMVSALVLPNARCSFAVPAALTKAELSMLAARQVVLAHDAGSLRCGGHVPSVRNALDLTQLSVRQVGAIVDGAATTDFVVTVTP